MTGQLSLVTTIYTVNRLSDLRDLVASIERQSVLPKLIVVVEGSMSLKAAVEGILLGLPNSPRVILTTERLGLSGARNLGARVADTDYVGFVDDDAILDPSWTRTVITEFDLSEDLIGITGITLPQWKNQEDSWIPRSLYWLIGCTDSRAPKKKEFVDWASGTNMVFRRVLFNGILFDQGLGGIKEHGKLSFAGDENDFVLRLAQTTGKHLLYCPDVRVFHKVPPYKVSATYIRRYSMMQGYAEARYSSEYRRIRRNAIRTGALLGLFYDLFFCSPDVLLKRLTATLNFGIFALIGYLAFRFPWLLVLGGA